MSRSRDGKPTNMDAILPGLLGRAAKRAPPNAVRLLEINVAFQRFGPPLSTQASPVFFRDGQLLIEVYSPAWMHQLSFIRTEIRDRLNSLLPKGAAIREIRFQLGVNKSLQKPLKRPLPPLSPEIKAQVQAWGAEIEDLEVREAYVRFAEASLRANRKLDPCAYGKPGPWPLPAEYAGYGAAPSSDPEPAKLRYGFGDTPIDRRNPEAHAERQQAKEAARQSRDPGGSNAGSRAGTQAGSKTGPRRP